MNGYLTLSSIQLAPLLTSLTTHEPVVVAKATPIDKLLTGAGALVIEPAVKVATTRARHDGLMAHICHTTHLLSLHVGLNRELLWSKHRKFPLPEKKVYFPVSYLSENEALG